MNTPAQSIKYARGKLDNIDSFLEVVENTIDKNTNTEPLEQRREFTNCLEGNIIEAVSEVKDLLSYLYDICRNYHLLPWISDMECLVCSNTDPDRYI